MNPTQHQKHPLNANNETANLLNTWQKRDDTQI